MNNELNLSQNFLSTHEESVEFKKKLWEELKKITVQEALYSFFSTLKEHTRRTYISAFKRNFEIWAAKKMLGPGSSLYTLAHCNMENLLDALRMHLAGSESTRQNRCASFISFTKYLHRVTGRLISCALPNSGANATFIKIREKACTKAITHEEWIRFAKALKENSFRDYLIAKAIFQGAKRCSEVLMAKIEDIDWKNERISYKQLKTTVLEKKTVITYSSEFIDELRMYLEGRDSGFIFVSRKGKALSQAHLHRAFVTASMQAGISSRVHPHMLRTTAITLFMKMGYHSDQIMRVSGHSNTASVIYYDKTPEEENLTTQVKII